MKKLVKNGNNRIENLGTDIMLEARNKNIVRLLEEKGNIIENRHTGIATMRDEMRKMGLPEPEFMSLRGDFKVIFRKENKSDIIQNFTENFTENLSKTQIKIIKEIEKNKTITQKNIANNLKVSRQTISTNIKKLKELRYIERIGSDRKGYWKILKNR